jgi:hypothetical protein
MNLGIVIVSELLFLVLKFFIFAITLLTFSKLLLLNIYNYILMLDHQN